MILFLFQDEEYLQSIKKYKLEKNRLLSSLDLLIKNYDAMKYRLESQVKKLTEDMLFYNDEIEKLIKEFDIYSPNYNKLRNSYEEAVNDYEEKRKKLIGKIH